MFSSLSTLFENRIRSSGIQNMIFFPFLFFFIIFRDDDKVEGEEAEEKSVCSDSFISDTNMGGET
jgi:hypothetical protein